MPRLIYPFLILAAFLLFSSPGDAQVGGPSCGINGTPSCNVNVTGGTGDTVTANQGTPGAVGWPITDSTGNDTAGTFTNGTQSTAITATLETGASAFSTVSVTIRGTYASATAQFQKSDDDTLTNWYPVQCSQEGAGVIETGYTSLTNVSRMWQCNVQGANGFRVQSSAVASGTANILISPSAMPTANGSTIAVAPANDLTGSGTITARDVASTTTTGQNSASIITGNPTANSTVSIAFNGRSAVETLITGTWTGTISLEGSADNGTTWTPFSAHVRGAAPAVATATSNGTFIANITGLTNYRVRDTAAITGTINVAFTVSQEAGVIYVNNALKLLDLNGTNQMTIKAASTAPLSTDTSVVVGLNPNSPLGAGTALIGKVGIDQTTPGTTNGVLDTGLNNTQGSTTSGQTGPLVQGAVTTAAPTYTTGQTDPISLDTKGNIRTFAFAQTNAGTNTGPLNADSNASGDTSPGTQSMQTVAAYNKIYNGATWSRSAQIGSQTSAGTGTTAVAIAPTSIAGAGITPIVSASAENNHVLKNSAGNLYSAYAANITATAGYLVILNSTTSPADGAITPLAVCNLPANGTCSINFNPGPAQVYSTGITAVVTSASTPFTKTTGTITAFISGSVM